MRFSTDDGHFGLIIMPVSGGMFRFQMVLQGHVIGNREPCFVFTPLRQFRKLVRLDGPDFSGEAYLPGVFSKLQNDDQLHDASMTATAESLDRWLIRGYMNGPHAIFLAKEADSEGNSILTSVLDADTYFMILDAVDHFCSQYPVTRAT